LAELPPPDPSSPRRPFNWQRDAPEWGEGGIDEDWLGCIFLLLGFACLAAGMVVLYLTVR